MTARGLVFTMEATDVDGPDGYAERRYVVRLGDHVVWTDPVQSFSYEMTAERERAEERFAADLASALAEGRLT